MMILDSGLLFWATLYTPNMLKTRIKNTGYMKSPGRGSKLEFQLFWPAFSGVPCFPGGSPPIQAIYTRSGGICLNSLYTLCPK